MKVPETHSFDLIVIGGGLAGLCAAISAARNGAKTALVQDRPVFGGNSSSEIRVVPHGSNHSNVWAAETGLIHEIVLADRAGNHDQFFDQGLINGLYDLHLLERAKAEENLTLFLNTSARDVDSEPLTPGTASTALPTSNGLGRIGGEPRRIVAVLASQLGSEREFRLEARHFLDATGDGTVGFLAGADFRYGREGRAEFNEPLAPLQPDDVTMGSTITMRARDVGRPVPYVAPPWIAQYRTPEDFGPGRFLPHLHSPVYGGYWWMEVCNPYHQISDNAAIRDELHRHVLGVWNYIKNHSDIREKATPYVLEWIGMVPGKRESRRLMGDVVLTEHDCHADRAWPDTIGFAGWWIDLHIKGGVLNKSEPAERENADAHYKHWIRVPLFTLPLRAHYSRNIENLWMAGRCLSTTHAALGSVRVMQTLAHLGQNVGIAAAYALRHDLTPRQTADPSGVHIGILQQRILRQDGRLPGIARRDPADLAPSARVSATSQAPFLSDAPNEQWLFWLGSKSRPGHPRHPALGMIVPLTHDRLDRVAFFLESHAGTLQTITVGLQSVDSIWDRPDQPFIASTTLDVPAGHHGWLEAELNATIMPGQSHRVVLSGGEDIGWTTSMAWPTGTMMNYLHVGPGGPEEKNKCFATFSEGECQIPAYRHWRQQRVPMTLRLSPSPLPFGPENVLSGPSSPERMPHLWVSDAAQPLPQFLEFRWEEARTISVVEIIFDTQLAEFHQMAEGFSRPSVCAKDWRLLAENEGKWREVFSETGNYLRKRFAHFATITTPALRLEVLATNGAPEARIFEVRCYT